MENSSFTSESQGCSVLNTSCSGCFIHINCLVQLVIHIIYWNSKHLPFLKFIMTLKKLWWKCIYLKNLTRWPMEFIQSKFFWKTVTYHIRYIYIYIYIYFFFLAPHLFSILWLPQRHCSLLSLDEAKDIFIKSQSNFLI